MDKTMGTIENISVEEVMTRSVVTVTANSTMAEAAGVLYDHQVSGAPVVDEQGRCVGVLSATDFVHSKAEELSGRDKVGHFLCSRHPSGLYSIDEVRHDLVRGHMTTAVQTIDRHATLLTAARCMCKEHVHRLIVLDENGTPIGILSSLDVVTQCIAGKEA